MPIPLLPRLNDENKTAITKRGEWITEAQNTLTNLVSDLKVTTNEQSNITSIPDLWARPAMYEMVLFDAKHHLHQKYVAQWRGILAMLAFKEMRGFEKLKVEPIHIPEASKIDDNQPSFLKVVASLLPDEYKKYEDKTVEKGHKLQILTYAERPLAIIWPTILVCPSVGLEYMVDRTVSWWNIDGISDPISSLNDQEKALLSKWLDNIIEKLPAGLNSLMTLVSDFRDDLAVSEKANNYGLGHGIGITGFCECIDKCIKCEIDENQFLSNSNVMLKRQRDNGALNLLVIAEDTYKQWNKAASDIIVAGNISLDVVLRNNPGGVIFRKNNLSGIDLAAMNAELRTPRDFFTEKICLLNGGDTLFPNSLYKKLLIYNRPKNVLLPIKKEILDYLTPDYIVDHFRISVVNDIDIKVELDLPLEGFDEDGSFVTIHKIYKGTKNSDDTKNDIIDNLNVPLIKIWPNFIPNNEENWKAYYSYYDNLSDVGTFLAEPLWNEEPVSRNLNYKGNFSVQLRKGTTFPEGYVCKAAVKTSVSTKEIEIGLILLAKPEKLQLEINNNCKIGVDFGTTNTVAYISMNDKEPELLHFQDRLYQVTNSNDMYCKQELRRHFMPSIEQPNGDIRSIRTLFNPNIGEFNGDLKQPIFPGVVYYLDGIDSIGKDKIFTNLVQGQAMKWDPQGIEFMTYFLLNLCIQCLAEAVVRGATHIEWHYSFPRAFGRDEEGRLNKMWGQNIEFLQTVCPNMISEQPLPKQESVSMATYFNVQMRAAIKSRGIACFDIGGGSTDIAIWLGGEDEKPKGKCSFKFAGNDILNKQLFKHRDVLKNNFMNNATEFNKVIEDLYMENDYDTFNIKLEALLKYQEKNIFNLLVSRTTNNDLKIFVRNIAFSLAGIFFYAGMIIGDLKKNQLLEGDLPHCYIGGNGSKLLDWVANGDYSNTSGFQQVYNMCLVGGALTRTAIARENMLFDVKQSTNPKEEVAYGLVCGIKNNAAPKSNTARGLDFDDLVGGIDDLINGIDDDDDDNRVIAGEALYLNGVFNENPIVTKSDIKNGIKVDSSMPQFNRFLNLFNKLISKQGYTNANQINLSERQLAEIRDRTNEELAQYVGVDEGKISLEPPFIVLLRNALDCIS